MVKRNVSPLGLHQRLAGGRWWSPKGERFVLTTVYFLVLECQPTPGVLHGSMNRLRCSHSVSHVVGPLSHQKAWNKPSHCGRRDKRALLILPSDVDPSAVHVIPLVHSFISSIAPTSTSSSLPTATSKTNTADTDRSAPVHVPDGHWWWRTRSGSAYGWSEYRTTGCFIVRPWTMMSSILRAATKSRDDWQCKQRFQHEEWRSLP